MGMTPCRAPRQNRNSRSVIETVPMPAASWPRSRTGKWCGCGATRRFQTLRYAETHHLCSKVAQVHKGQTPPKISGRQISARLLRRSAATLRSAIGWSPSGWPRFGQRDEANLQVAAAHERIEQIPLQARQVGEDLFKNHGAVSASTAPGAGRIFPHDHIDCVVSSLRTCVSLEGPQRDGEHLVTVSLHFKSIDLQ